MVGWGDQERSVIPVKQQLAIWYNLLGYDLHLQTQGMFGEGARRKRKPKVKSSLIGI